MSISKTRKHEANVITVWVLRSWKLQEMHMLELAKEQRAVETDGNDTNTASPQEADWTPPRTITGSSSVTTYLKSFVTAVRV